MNDKLTFIVPVTKEDVLSKNVLSSKVYRDGRHQFIFQRGYTNVPKAYNDAIAATENDILVFCHQDVYFPDAWEREFYDSLRAVNALDPNWGVLGAAGVKLTKKFFGLRYGVDFVGNFSTNVAGGAFVIDHLRPREYPQRVHTLDEFVIIVKKENAVFDEDIPNNHFYGVDICLNCARRGLRTYAISAYVHHDSTLIWVFSDFYESAKYMYSKYKDMLPIATTCVIIEDQDGKAKFRNDFLAMMSMTLHSIMKFPKRATRTRRPV